MSVNKLNVFNVTANWNELDQECAAAELALISESINNKWQIVKFKLNI